MTFPEYQYKIDGVSPEVYFKDKPIDYSRLQIIPIEEACGLHWIKNEDLNKGSHVARVPSMIINPYYNAEAFLVSRGWEIVEKVYGCTGSLPYILKKRED